MGRTTLLLLAVLALGVAGCGAGGSAAPGSSPKPSAGGPSSSSNGDSLLIVVDDGSGRTTRWTLRCSPPGGDHPDPASACAALVRGGATALPPVPKDQACTQIYGGAQTASITGRWDGRDVLSTFSLVNGCEIARWKALEGLLPPAGA